jgi:hypothetical protein
MNDFTKEELQIILLEINININRHKGLLTVAPSYQALKDKIESMIDNYCEHENKPIIKKELHKQSILAKPTAQKTARF